MCHLQWYNMAGWKLGFWRNEIRHTNGCVLWKCQYLVKNETTYFSQKAKSKLIWYDRISWKYDVGAWYSHCLAWARLHCTGGSAELEKSVVLNASSAFWTLREKKKKDHLNR